MKPSAVVATVTAAILVYFFASLYNEPGACHVLHLAAPPDGLYSPVLVHPGRVDTSGRELDLSFSPEYCELYTLGFVPRQGAIARDLVPALRVSADVEHRGVPVATFDLDRPSAMRLEAGGSRVRRIEYGRFGLPSSDEPVRVRVRVTAADPASAEQVGGMDLVIVVNASP